MPSIRRKIENIWPEKKIFFQLNELLRLISMTDAKERIILSIEKINHGREYCQMTLSELEFLYLLAPRINRSFYECIHQTHVVKVYIDFEYLLENNLAVDHHRAIITCLKILLFYLKKSTDSNIIPNMDLPSVLDEFLVLNAYVCFNLSLLPKRAAKKKILCTSKKFLGKIQSVKNRFEWK